MYGRGKSDSPIVPGKSPNKAGQEAAAEAMEGRGLAKGNAVEADAHRTSAGYGRPVDSNACERQQGRTESSGLTTQWVSRTLGTDTHGLARVVGSVSERTSADPGPHRRLYAITRGRSPVR